MASSKLVAKREELAAKQKKAAEIFAEAGDDLDFEKITSLEGSTKDKAEKLQALEKELGDLYDECKELASREERRNRIGEIGKELEEPAAQPTVHPTKDREQPKSIGEQITELDGYKRWLKDGKPSGRLPFGEIAAGLKELKTTFTTSAGWSPESTRSGRLVEEALRPIQVIDIVPDGTMSQAAYVYMEETTVTENAAERAEEGAYAESAFALTQRSQSAVSIGHFVPVTDEQLEDVPAARSYLDMRLISGVRRRLDGQLLTGDGTGSNLTGILNNGSIQTQAKGADPTPDAIHKAMTAIRVTGRANPNFVVLHPNDWQAIRLLRTSDGVYIWGSPSEAGPMRIWGIPVVPTDAETENTGLVGDFTYCQLFERRGIMIEVGYIDDDFKDGRRSIRAGMRVAFPIYRPEAFCEVTGI